MPHSAARFNTRRLVAVVISQILPMMHRYWSRFACVCAAVIGFPLAVAATQVPDMIGLQALRQFYADTNGTGKFDNTN